MNEDKNFYDQLKIDVQSNNNNKENTINNTNMGNSISNTFSNLISGFDNENYKLVNIQLTKVILVRKDLKMGVGKIAAQVGHAG